MGNCILSFFVVLEFIIVNGDQLCKKIIVDYFIALGMNY